MSPSGLRGLLVVLSGPSASGKTTIARALEQRLGGSFSVSATTRPQSPGERPGHDYDFMDEAEFRRRAARGEFLEHARVFGRHWYGTPRRPVEERLAEGGLIILDIDVQGAMQVRRSMPQALMIFFLPPSDAELEKRMRARRRDSEDAMQARLAEARREIEQARSSNTYDAFVVNDELDRAIAETCRLVREARQR